jgi:hypothetical protein
LQKYCSVGSELFLTFGFPAIRATRGEKSNAGINVPQAKGMLKKRKEKIRKGAKWTLVPTFKVTWEQYAIKH